MRIVGLSAYSHEACAALVVDGEVRAVVEEERLNREKHTSRFPEQALSLCLEIGGLSPRDVDAFTFFWQPLREIAEGALYVARHLPASLRLFGAPSGSSERGAVRRIASKLTVSRAIARALRLPSAPRVHFVPHHLAHAASAFHLSGFEEAAILTCDGRGEATSTSLAVGSTRVGRNGGIRSLLEVKVPHSLGHLYAAVTDHLGFRPFADEGKVMGMAALGGRDLFGAAEQLVGWPDPGRFALDLRYFDFPTHGSSRWTSARFAGVFGPRRLPGAPLEKRHFDLAAALQHVIEGAGARLAQHLHAITGLSRLCVAGGLALNVLMNSAIVERSGFEEVFFQPLAGDAGAALGSALCWERPVPGTGMHDVYWGPSYDGEAILAALSRHGLSPAPLGAGRDVAEEAARRIAQGQVVGWFQGRMEAGPRALGNRSLLANPALPAVRERLNARIKKRESFRPFAPSVLEERASELFAMPRGVTSPFMMLAGAVRPEKRALLAAVTHADGTARVHTVSRAVNPRFHALLTELGRLTGVPVALNTSFNEEEPIVCTPEHAIACFLRTGIDALAIGDFFVEKVRGSGGWA